MPNRILKESIRTSKNINSITDFQYRLYTYLITYVDDYGRGSADAEILKGIVFTRRKGITERQISEGMAALANKGMIILYEAEGESFFYFPNWEKHQTIRAKKSKFPEPENICMQMQADESICSRNPIQSESNPNPNPNRIVGAGAHPTLDEVKAYCLERKNSVSAEAFMDYYESNGWKVGRNPMKDWKAAVRTWERKEKGDSNADIKRDSRERAKAKWNLKYD